MRDIPQHIDLQRNIDKMELFNLVFDNIPGGAMITDPDGIVTHLNRPYADFLGMDPRKSVGKHCSEVVENSRMHIVGKTGIPEINQIHMIRGQNIVVHRIPLKRGDKVVAVFGLVMFQDISEVVKLSKKMHFLESKVRCYEKELMKLRSTRFTLDCVLGTSTAILALKKEALMAAANSSPVLITGESGTGKEVFAQAIHHASQRRLQPFIHINCAAIPKDLLESELFGYDRGAFTGALSTGKPGKFEMADQGTIFLDEIGDMSLEMQPKLLRVLEEKCFERVGGNTLIRSNFRLIAATNQDLESLIAKGNFRKDLFYRLNVISLRIPPLRERPEDVIPIASYLLTRLAQKNGCASAKISSKAMQALTGHVWQGNVRELSNILERALLVMQGDEILISDLPFAQRKEALPAVSGNIKQFKDIRSDTEISAILEALRNAQNNKARAADLLGIHRTSLYKKMKKYGLSLQNGM
ncbi:MAG: sigma 54-interacting transcriptional regulator [Desulfocapsaceae bacterium]|nr:sigma 54-interacting transcriptional regulator [Desulfocapsaceae bacterium]